MGWLRDRLARLGVRGPVGRDSVAAAVLAGLGLARLPLALAVNGGRLPVPAWELAAANLAATADVATIALRRRAPRTALALATTVVVGAAALPVRYAMTGLGVLVCAYTVATLLPWRRAAAVLGGCALVHAAGGAAVTAAGGELRLLLTFWGVDGQDLVDVVLATAASYGIPGLLGAYVPTRRAYTAELVARAERLEREQQEQARLAVVEERGRIARELHDIAVDDAGVRVVVANAVGAAKGVESASGRPSTDSDRQDRRSGHGLAGMRERVQLTGGTVVAGPTGQGGWRVEAWLPAPPPLDGRP